LPAAFSTANEQPGQHRRSPATRTRAAGRNGRAGAGDLQQEGLHARASAKFVQTVERFDAEVRVTRGQETVGGTSIMGLMMLAAGPGTSITVEATGAEAAEAVEALASLVAGRFTEGE
jgi:phosphocarrier protein HPr